MPKLFLLSLKLACCFLLFICNPTWLFFSAIVYWPIALSLDISTSQALAHHTSLALVILISFFLLGLCFYQTCKSHKLDQRETQEIIMESYIVTHCIYLLNPVIFYALYQSTHSFVYLVGLELMFLMIAPITHKLFTQRLEKRIHQPIDI